MRLPIKFFLLIIFAFHITNKAYSQPEKELLINLMVAEKNNDLKAQTVINKQLSELYEKNNNPLKAFEFYKKSIHARNTIASKKIKDEELTTESRYNFEKKQINVIAEQKKKDLLFIEEKHKQRIILYFILGILSIVGLFAITLSRAWFQKRRATAKMLLLKNEMEIKQKAILDSIYYARRIQQSLLPTETFMERNLNRLQKK